MDSPEFHLLSRIYRFPFQTLQVSQDPEICKSLLNIVLSFCRSILDSKLDISHTGYSTADIEFTIQLLSRAKEKRNHESLQWLPEYGCLILYDILPKTGWIDQYCINVIGLDKFVLKCHKNPNGGGYQKISVASEYRFLHVGRVSGSDQLRAVQEKFLDLFNERSVERHGSQRTAARGDQGHQKTASWIHALLLQAHESQYRDCDDVLPEGGFTDVGLHTGGIERETCWALVRSFFQWSLSQRIALCDETTHQNNAGKENESFRLLCGYLDLYLLQAYGPSLTNPEPSSTAIDNIAYREGPLYALMWMMQRVTLNALHFSAKDQRMMNYHVIIESFRAKIDAVISKWESNKAELYKLKTIDVSDFCSVQLNLPLIPESSSFVENTSYQEKKRKITSFYDERMRAYSCWSLPSQIGKNCWMLESLDNWLRSHETSTDFDEPRRVFLIRTVEVNLWQVFNIYFSGEHRPLPELSIPRLLNIIDSYRSLLHPLKSSPIILDCCMDSQLKSREILLVWASYCLAFDTVWHAYPDIMNESGVALEYEHLRHLVLSDGLEIEVMKKVVSYLESKYAPGGCLFRLDSSFSDATLQMAEKYADKFLRNQWHAWYQDSEKRKSDHWNEVLHKRRQLLSLRDDENRLATSLAAKERTRKDLERMYYGPSHTRVPSQREANDIQEAINKEKSAKENLDDVKGQIERTRKAPSYVIQALPRDKKNAMKVLFFLYMPESFRLLARLTVTAQQLFLPAQSWHKIHKKSTSWLCHFRAYYSSSVTLEPCDVDLHITYTASSYLPSEVGPRFVEHFSSAEDGVWYPDDIPVMMVWDGGPHIFDQLQPQVKFDPFHLSDRELIVRHLSQAMRSPDDSLSWALVIGMDANQRSRCSQAYASQDEKPSWLSKEGYISFCTIRAHPFRQMREICLAIDSNSIPLSHDATRVLFEQALYHIGDLSIDKEKVVNLMWKSSKELTIVAEAFIITLKKTVETLKDSPTEYGGCRLVAMLCNFFSHFKPGFKELARELALSALRWADQDMPNMDLSPADVCSLRSRQYVFRCVALLCLTGGKVEEIVHDDIDRILQINVQLRNASFANEDISSNDAIKRKRLKFCCEYALSKLVPWIVNELENDPSPLDGVLSCVIPTAVSKSGFRWTRLKQVNTCFDTCDDQGHYYTVNILTGDVLFNGLPPHRLPPAIISHYLYKRSFGDLIFDVVMKDDVYYSIVSLKDRFYRFQLTGTTLRILETSSSLGSKDPESRGADTLYGTLELLDHSLIDVWGKVLPIHLKETFSHWRLLHDESVVLFRHLRFDDRRVSYVCIRGRCFQIPDHFEDKGYDSILKECKTNLYDELLATRSEIVPVIDVLQKFENKDYIHVYVPDNKKDVIRFELYRYRIAFNYLVSEGKLMCEGFDEFYLAESQYLFGTLIGLHKYLVIENSLGQKRVLIPDGKVVVDQSSISIDVKKFHYHIFDLHPHFQSLIATQGIASRLHLACLHLATGSIFPDPLLVMTGEERGMLLLRQCWVNRTLTSEEKNALDNIIRVSSGRCSSISLLCNYVAQSACFASCLYDLQQNRLVYSVNHKDVFAYQIEKEDRSISSRLFLTHEESCCVFGMVQGCNRFYHQVPLREIYEVHNHTVSVTKEDLATANNELSDMWRENIQSATCTEFPLRTKDMKCFLDREIYGELQKSFELYCKKMSTVKRSLVLDRAGMTIKLDLLFARVTTMSKDVLGFISHRVKPSDSSFYSVLNLVNVLPSCGRSDLASAVCFPQSLSVFSPNLTTKRINEIKVDILLWLELEVLLDKLKTLKRLLMSTTDSEILDQYLVDELVATRKFDSEQYPYWIVFEVENCLRIRPYQYEVACHMISNPGHIMQLNMGQGKTKVILPMLVLHWCLSDSVIIPRLHIPSALYDEFVHYFHDILTASVLVRKMFVSPFNRNVCVMDYEAKVLASDIQKCRECRGFFLIAPEHRLSLELKVTEMCIIDRNELGDFLQKNVMDVPWYDIVDEIDDLMHPKHQLVYAKGAVEPLPEGRRRWQCVQALLHILNREKLDCFEFKNEERDLHRSGVFVVHRVEKKDKVLSELVRLLSEKLLSDPPYSLRWTKGHHKITSIKAVMIDPSCDPDILSGLCDAHLFDVLALRGLLAGELFLHCLQKRNRVDYGINRNSSKLSAVPFRAAETPSERSEFSHPECHLIFTMLAYYHDGLHDDQVREAFESLLERGSSERHAVYSEWYNSLETKPVIFGVDKVDKIDLSNKIQFAALVQNYWKNMYVIDFWLNIYVFPFETLHYPQRLCSNAWHLAHNKNGNIVGFSGTNEGHRALPLQVQQYLPWDDDKLDSTFIDMLSTNGRMIDLLIKKSAYIELKPKSSQADTLIACIGQLISSNKTVHALIDCGAMLVGVKLKDFAKLLMKHVLPNHFCGVTFFENGQGHKGWMILERSGRCRPKSLSHVDEKSTFVIYDEPRCRGSDLKLLNNAIGLLTLGHDTSKDKLMQAAGRMRQLHLNQQLIIVGTNVISDNIRRAINISPTQTLTSCIDSLTGENNELGIDLILSWTVENSIYLFQKNLQLWCDQAYYFLSTKGHDAIHRLLDDRKSLQDYYGAPIEEESIAALAKRGKEQHLRRAGLKELSDQTLQDYMNRVCETCQHFGQNYLVRVSGADEECEKELELEVEKEEEEEIEIPAMITIDETDWNWEAVLHATSYDLLPCTLISLDGMIQTYVKNGLQNVDWTKKVFCTNNYIATVLTETEGDDLVNFLRLVDMMLVFTDGDVVLLSEREGDNILKAYLGCDDKKKYSGPCLAHFQFQSKTQKLDRAYLHTSPGKIGCRCSYDVDVMASLQIFSGEVMFSSNVVKDAVKRTLLSAGASGSRIPPLILDFRGKQSTFSHSDMDDICGEITCIFENDSRLG